MSSTSTLSAEQRRLRAGIATLCAGVLLIIFAYGSWIVRSSVQPGVVQDANTDNAAAQNGSEDTAGGTIDGGASISALANLVMTMMILIVVTVVGSIVITRWWRRYIASTRAEKISPTQSSDTWSMHRLPEDDSGQ